MLDFLIGLCPFLIFYYWDEIFTPIQNFFSKKYETRANFLKTERLAQVRLLSDDPKEIEKFITQNVDILSDKTHKSLVARLENLKADSVVNDDFLKVRFAALEEAEEKQSTKRAVRK